MAKLVKIAETNELTPGAGKVVQADGRTLALFNVNGTFYAIDNTCTHRGGPLSEGTLSEDTVECPWHGATFDVKSGAVKTAPAPTGVKSYPVQLQGTDVLVELDG